MQDRPADSDSIPFGAMEVPPKGAAHGERAPGGNSGGNSPAGPGGHGGNGGNGKRDWRRPENRRGNGRRGGRRRRRGHDGGGERHGPGGGEAPPGSEVELAVATESEAPPRSTGEERGGEGGERRGRRRRRRRRGGREPYGGGGAGEGEGGGRPEGPRSEGEEQRWRERGTAEAPREAALATGLFMSEHGGFGTLRMAAQHYLPSRDDVYVPKHLVQRFKLRDGAIVVGRIGRGQGKHRHQLLTVGTVDDRPPQDAAGLPVFKKLISIDPDFHYAVGDASGDVSMRILDVICPVGRGTRGLIVAPPRSGKTILMRKFAAAIEQEYPDVHLMVLLIDERPEEATEWVRSIQRGQVFVSTNDELARHHVQVAEVVWARACRLVELGHDVVLLLDSITRLARAYNNLGGGSGRTMSGGIDSRTMEKPRAFFGSARNTESAGSLTILGTTLVETGSRMDQVIFEEFKGTGNMELVLSRKLADRRIFPAIDIERSGTRKEEKLFSRVRLKRITTLRRVLLKMSFIEAMELLVAKLEDVEKTDDFLARFEVDPEA